MTKNNNEKPTLIIIEGIDGVGKSTVAKKISEMLNLPVEHHGPVKSMEEGKKEYFDFIEKCDYSVVKDRFAMGEETYSIIYRGYKADYMRDLEKALMEKFKVKLFFITGEDDFIKHRLQSRGEDFLDLNDFSKTKKLAHDYFENSILPKRMLMAENGSLMNAFIILADMKSNEFPKDIIEEKCLPKPDLHRTIHSMMKRQGGK